MPSISDLAAHPPDDDAERSIVLKNYHEIRAARGNGWTWPAIANSLGRNPRALSGAYHRVQIAIKTGRLDPARLGGNASKAGRPSRQTSSQSVRSNFQNLDTEGLNQ